MLENRQAALGLYEDYAVAVEMEKRIFMFDGRRVYQQGKESECKTICKIKGKSLKNVKKEKYLLTSGYFIIIILSAIDFSFWDERE